MEMRMYLREWNGIELATLSNIPVDDVPVGLEFYREFYGLMAAGRGRLPPAWIEAKRGFGRLLGDLFKKWHPGGTNILAVASGNAPAESEWLASGFDVVFNDCQIDSLDALREKHPAARYLIADANRIETDERFDLITLLAFDYIFQRRPLANFLGQLARLLRPGGRIVLHSPSTLSWRQGGVEIVRRFTQRTLQKRGVFWGWWRSPSEYLKVGRLAGLDPAIYEDGPHGFVRRPRWRAGWMSLKSPHLLAVYRRDS